jgi:hypothetical protein
MLFRGWRKGVGGASEANLILPKADTSQPAMQSRVSQPERQVGAKLPVVHLTIHHESKRSWPGTIRDGNRR